MENKLIQLDTDFLIEYLYNNPAAIDIIKNNPLSFFVIGFTTITELIKGTLNKIQQHKISRSIKGFHIF